MLYTLNYSLLYVNYISKKKTGRIQKQKKENK